MAFVAAYDTETGKKLPYLVPERHIDHPVLGARLSRLPSRKKARKTDAPPATLATESSDNPVDIPTNAPAVGDNKKE